VFRSSLKEYLSLQFCAQFFLENTKSMVFLCQERRVNFMPVLFENALNIQAISWIREISSAS